MENKDLFDAVIVGGGPAGLTAAIYLARARYRVVVIEKEKFGGQITITSEVVNYPGVEKVSGEALTTTMQKQAQAFGAEFMVSEVRSIENTGDIKIVNTSSGPIKAFSVLIATGANPRRLGFLGEDEFRGRGVAYCATCDGEFFSGKELLVVGGGFAAAEEAMFLTRYASKVTILVRKDKFSCASSIVEELLKNPKIKVLYHHELKEVKGDENGIKQAVIINNETKENFVYESHDKGSFGVFVFAGYVPNTNLVKDLLDLDESGYVITDKNLETSSKGIFAAGDICIKPLRQVVTATADGALAANAMEKLAATMQDKTGITPKVPQANTNKKEDNISSSSSKLNEAKFISQDMLPQLDAVFSRLTSNITLEIYKNDDKKSIELLEAMKELVSLSDKLSLKEIDGGEDAPCVRILKDDVFSGLAFHGVPGGHEFTSFILGIYNVGSQGQALDPSDLKKILSIDKELKMKIFVSLSCTMCPDLVVAAQRMASLNPLIEAQIYDLNLFPELKDKYKVMSVPVLVINDDKVSFGKKNISEILKLI